MIIAELNWAVPLLVVPAITFVGVVWWRYHDRVAVLEQEVAILKTQMSPLWSSVQSQIARDLTHPHPQFAEMDELLQRLENLTITDAERVRLGLLLEERILSTDPEISEDERASAKLLKGVMKKVLKEKENAA